VLYPPRNHPELHLVGDHAYWVSGLKLSEGAEHGQIDVFSYGFGRGDPEVGETERGSGTLEGGNLGSLIYTTQLRRWGKPPAQDEENRLVVTATGIASAAIDVRRARVGCDAEVEIESDGPMAVRLRGCDRIVTG
jgi:hypothetical protein